eukprot:CAMPEP_0178430410 /NCGR_PEP_ID=MMETSP0689_2-20121128/31305_1 /TAXON_ID=160604 /ORGANISM="Amphidinium massartii, Strain CS-259" /LENGTH=107 /DNA_ID=CAMNT_0020052265 /DNA_START=327 /DNA_END=650 /DNA_ORIENTATION=+
MCNLNVTPTEPPPLSRCRDFASAPWSSALVQFGGSACGCSSQLSGSPSGSCIRWLHPSLPQCHSGRAFCFSYCECINTPTSSSVEALEGHVQSSSASESATSSLGCE